MRHARISAYLLLVTGTFHTLIGLVDGYPQFAVMARDGLFDTVTASPEREAIFWFLIAGFGFLVSGLLALGYKRLLSAPISRRARVQSESKATSRPSTL